ncbi:class I SAM-dependent DNA methyltransferase [Qipengyuania qiaonensis]|uniref:site-specific DNA-methyltransferase (adenine-specific) n=1 Tax=Qipengyuania qiaonensis TaxID=2867240 RepID=A0ABS7J4S6_9SPHN|nr:DNA methyltransferase [Qipengyuania qiaonensis]MBX7482334.1 class I SAM-dependent DNA methyltransferase [Qipengyuania qiaonensis]
MTAQEFIAKWRNTQLNERAASQSHFNDLCALLGVDDPITADPKGEWYAFEKGATKTSGGEGWADVWRKGCFAWEYKGKKKDLNKAFAQLQQYAIALENPPLLIVSDMDRFRMHTNWTNTVQEVHEFALDDLIDGATREMLRAAFEDPERLRPAKTRQMLTEEAAEEFARLAQRLRDRGHEGHTVAHFVNRLVFCMFAEDVGLLPGHMFSEMLKASRSQPESFAGHAATLFAAMKSGGLVGFTKVEWFNGGLFDDDSALPLDRNDIDSLIAAAALDWSEVDPSILGTLFERGLDPDKRSQLGAHYTDRDKIMQIVGPVIQRPLTAEWEAIRGQIEELVANAPQQTAEKLLRGAEKTKRDRAFAMAQELLRGFVERLRTFRVLDPACGSGNFLYLSLLALKDLEHRANLEAEALGCSREFPAVGPESVLGIELNPYAAELARVSVWIGEIQWMRRNGFEAARNPILRSLGNIECRDAVLDVVTGERARWPEANVVVGNPPFLGNKKMIAELGEEYTTALRKAWPQVPGGADLVCYWFAGAWDRMVAHKLKRAGLVSTNSIRSGTNRDVLKPIVQHGRIYEAWGDQEWTVEGAAVRVSLLCFDREQHTGAVLDGKPVEAIYADLSGQRGGVDLTSATQLPVNAKVAFQGPVKVGPFDIDGALAREMLGLPSNPDGSKNSKVIVPLLNGSDITRRPSDRWIIDFGERTETDASLYETPFEYVRKVVKPVRDMNRRERRRQYWWQHGETVPGIKRAVSGLGRAILTPRVAKHRLFVWTGRRVVPDSRVVIICRDDDCAFGVLHSSFHEVWSLALGGWHGVGNDPQYTPTQGFETFPFPEGLTPDIPAANYAGDPRAVAIAIAAARLNELRENWLNPPDLIERVPEVVPGYPDRLLPKNEAAAQELKKRTLTNLYNVRPAWLDHAHRALDEAVADAYGWGDDFRAGTLTDDEILARLFQLNQDRASK